MKAPRPIYWASSLGMCLALLLLSSSAHAYPWMIRHGYTSCMPCHTDPSGGAGALTDYGRAQSDLLLRMRYGEASDSGEADRTSALLWGLIAPLPGQVRLGGDFREAFYSNKADGVPLQDEFITMRADLYGTSRSAAFARPEASATFPRAICSRRSPRPPATTSYRASIGWGPNWTTRGLWLLRAGRMALSPSAFG